MKLMLGTDDNAIALAQQVGDVWKPSPTHAANMVVLLQSADPEDFEMWVEET